MEDIQIQCDPEVKGWNGEPDPRKTFYKQADFGFLIEKRRTVKKYCQPLGKLLSSQSIFFLKADCLGITIEAASPSS